MKSGSPESRVNALQLRFRLVNFNPALWAFCTSAVIRFDIKGFRLSFRCSTRAASGLQYLDELKIVILKLAALIVAATRVAYAQNISIGAALGTNLTRNFPPSSMATGLYYTDTRTLVGGAVADWAFPGPVSIEADGLYRRLHALIPPTSSFSVVTWEFPILANYRLSVAGVTALLEAGPSLRATGNLNDIHPSHYGFTAGLGVETQMGRLRVAPIARYTHWAADQHPTPSTVRTETDQLELLVVFRARSLSNAHPLGSRLSFGVVTGTNLSGDFHTVTVSEFAAVRGPLANSGYSFQHLNASFRVSGGPMSFLGGPLVSLQLPKRLSVQAQAVYRPLRSSTQVLFADGRSHLSLKDHRTSWEFPILAQYQWRVHRAGPFVELGPAFHLLQGVYGASPYVIAAGAGVKVRVGHLKMAPGLRFSHWARSDPPTSTDPRRSEFAILTGFSF